MKIITYKDALCDECGKHKEKMVELNGVVDLDFWVCKECLKKAIRIVMR